MPSSFDVLLNKREALLKYFEYFTVGFDNSVQIFSLADHFVNVAWKIKHRDSWNLWLF